MCKVIILILHKSLTIRVLYTKYLLLCIPSELVSWHVYFAIWPLLRRIFTEDLQRANICDRILAATVSDKIIKCLSVHLMKVFFTIEILRCCMNRLYFTKMLSFSSTFNWRMWNGKEESRLVSL